MVKVETLYSERLGCDREIYVFLPPGYEEDTERTYPVLYMQDGQNIFSAAGEGPMCWDVDSTALSLIEEEAIEDLIIVGISNSEWRDDEYTPSFDGQEGSGGRADQYIHFLIDEVKGHIDSTYRVRPFREDTGIAGSSLGGLLALYAAMEYPDFFGKIAAISPSIWWDNHVILDVARQWDIDPAAIKLWIDIGFNEDDETDEGGEGLEDAEDIDDAEDADDTEDADDAEESDEETGEEDGDDEDAEEATDDDEDGDDSEEDDVDPVEDARSLCDILEEKGFEKGENFQYFEDPWGSHDEVSWGGRMGMILTYLYRK